MAFVVRDKPKPEPVKPLLQRNMEMQHKLEEDLGATLLRGQINSTNHPVLTQDGLAKGGMLSEQCGGVTTPGFGNTRTPDV